MAVLSDMIDVVSIVSLIKSDGGRVEGVEAKVTVAACVDGMVRAEPKIKTKTQNVTCVCVLDFFFPFFFSFSFYCIWLFFPSRRHTNVRLSKIALGDSSPEKENKEKTTKKSHRKEKNVPESGG